MSEHLPAPVPATIPGPGHPPGPLVIVGTGIAGATPATHSARQGIHRTPGPDRRRTRPPYRQPPLSKEVLLGSQSPTRTLLRPAASWAAQDIELLTGTVVTELAPDDRHITLGDGSRMPYGRLLLATGGRCPDRGRSPPCGRRRAHRARSRGCRSGLGLRGPRGGGGDGTTGRCGARADRPGGRGTPPCARRRLPYRGATRRFDRAEGGIEATAANGLRLVADTVVVVSAWRPPPNSPSGPDWPSTTASSWTSTAPPRRPASSPRATGPTVPTQPLVAPAVSNTGRTRRSTAPRWPAPCWASTTPYAHVLWYWTRQYDVNLQVCGNPQAAQSMTVSGSIEALDFSAVLQQGDQVVGLVCAGRPADFRRLRPTVTGHAPGDGAAEAAGAGTGDVRPRSAPAAGARPTTGSADFTDSEGSVGSRCSESAGGSEG